MGSMHLKITCGDFSCDLEGDQESVVEIFREMREEGIGKIQEAVSFNQASTREEMKSSSRESNLLPTKTVSLDSCEWPPFNTVSIQGKAQSNLEWILLSAVYASDFKPTPIPDSSIKDKLEESKHFGDNEKKNYSRNMKALISKGYIEALVNNEYLVTEDGLNEAKAIIAREKTKPKNGKANKTKRRTASYALIPELKLDEEQKTHFKNFWDTKNPTTAINKAVYKHFGLKTRST